MSLSGLATAALLVLGIIVAAIGFQWLFPTVAAWVGVVLQVWELAIFGFGVVIAIVLSYQNWLNRHVK